MTYTISYQEKAIREYEIAVQWYRLKSERAAINFEIAVNSRIALLRTSPGIFKKVYKQFHEISLEKYPFSIVYLIDIQQKVVIIFSFFHHKRNPKMKYRK